MKFLKILVTTILFVSQINQFQIDCRGVFPVSQKNLAKTSPPLLQPCAFPPFPTSHQRNECGSENCAQETDQASSCEGLLCRNKNVESKICEGLQCQNKNDESARSVSKNCVGEKCEVVADAKDCVGEKCAKILNSKDGATNAVLCANGECSNRRKLDGGNLRDKQIFDSTDVGNTFGGYNTKSGQYDDDKDNKGGYKIRDDKRYYFDSIDDYNSFHDLYKKNLASVENPHQTENKRSYFDSIDGLNSFDGFYKRSATNPLLDGPDQNKVDLNNYRNKKYFDSIDGFNSFDDFYKRTQAEKSINLDKPKRYFDSIDGYNAFDGFYKRADGKNLRDLSRKEFLRKRYLDSIDDYNSFDSFFKKNAGYDVAVAKPRNVEEKSKGDEASRNGGLILDKIDGHIRDKNEGHILDKTEEKNLGLDEAKRSFDSINGFNSFDGFYKRNSENDKDESLNAKQPESGNRAKSRRKRFVDSPRKYDNAINYSLGSKGESLSGRHIRFPDSSYSNNRAGSYNEDLDGDTVGNWPRRRRYFDPIDNYSSFYDFYYKRSSGSADDENETRNGNSRPGIGFVPSNRRSAAPRRSARYNLDPIDNYDAFRGYY